MLQISHSRRRDREEEINRNMEVMKHDRAAGSNNTILSILLLMLEHAFSYVSKYRSPGADAPSSLTIPTRGIRYTPTPSRCRVESSFFFRQGLGIETFEVFFLEVWSIFEHLGIDFHHSHLTFLHLQTLHFFFIFSFTMIILEKVTV